MSTRANDVSSHIKAGVSFADAARPSTEDIAKARALLARVDAMSAKKGEDVLDISTDSDADSQPAPPLPLKSARKKESLPATKETTSLRSPAQIASSTLSSSRPRPRPRPVPRKVKSAAIVVDSDDDGTHASLALVKDNSMGVEETSSDNLPTVMDIFDELDAQKSGLNDTSTPRKPPSATTAAPFPKASIAVERAPDSGSEPLHEQTDEAVLESLFARAGKKRDFLLGALELLAKKTNSDSGSGPDPDYTMADETRRVLQSMLTSKGVKRSHEKGPGNRPNDLDHTDQVLESDDGLSDYERRELKRLRKSRPDKSEVVPEAIGSQSPSNDHEELPVPPTAIPATPKRRVRKGVQDLIAAAGEVPVTPPVAPSSPTTPSPSPSSTAGSIIESRLLAPPPTNELPLDMSDGVIRMTAKQQLYRLAHIFLKSWNENLMGPGFVRFIVWALQCPEMDGELALSFVTFEDCDSYGNLSRMDISKVFTMRVSQTATRYHAVTKDGRPFIFLTSGFLDASQLMTTSPVGMKNRFVKIIPHEGEHQRMGCAACTIFGFESMKTQYAKHALQFSTRAEYTPNNASSPSPNGKSVASGLFTGASNGNGSRVSMDAFSLPNNAEVPIYDARDIDHFDVNKDLPNLSSKLPRFYHEIPYGSFVVVGYTMTAFFSSAREWTLGLNIQWVILVGTPSDSK